MSIKVQKFKDLIDHSEIDVFYEGTAKQSLNISLGNDAANPDSVKRPKPVGGVMARCYAGTCKDLFHWVVLPKKAVSGEKCWDCDAPLVFNHKTGRATYKGTDACICYGCTPGDLIANARYVPKRK